MTINDYIGKLSGADIDQNKINIIEKAYACSLNELMQKIVSNCEETVFLDDDKRVLTFSEIVNAENELHVCLTQKGIIPIIDCGENDFIVYHYTDGDWAKFNIIDEVLFKRKNDLTEMS